MLFENPVEIVAVLTGLFAIYFQIKANPLYWPISIINVILNAIIFHQARLYAEISLQVYYFGMNISMDEFIGQKRAINRHDL